MKKVVETFRIMTQQEIIKCLQFYVTGLSQQADGHVIQSRIFASQGLNKLAEKYANHAAEERGFVNRFIDRILELGGSVENQAKEAAPVCTDPIEWIKVDLKVSEDGLADLLKVVNSLLEDPITYDIMKDYYIDEVQDLDWSKQQLELIEKIGSKKWYSSQI